MKRYILLFLKCFLLFALISGCSGLQVEREVMHDNTFVSNNPNLSIKLSPEFKYVGNRSASKTQTSLSGSQESRASHDIYCFVEPNKNMVKRSVAIRFHKIKRYNAHFVSDFFRNVKNAIAKGTTKCGGKSFQYYIKEVYPSMNSPITRHITDQGYTMGHGITKVFGRIYGAKEDTLVYILYYESLDDSKFDYKAWKNSEELTQKQAAFLSEFNKRAELSFDLMK